MPKFKNETLTAIVIIVWLTLNTLLLLRGAPALAQISEGVAKVAVQCPTANP